MDENLSERSKSEEVENENKPLKVFCTKKVWADKLFNSDFLYRLFNFH